MKKELSKLYEPNKVEDKIYKYWLDGGFFHAEPDSKKEPYCIVIPPPNITGQLHMGHALDETLQDILIRWKRMSGYAAEWIPGTDHASIATEAKIVEAMRKEGLTKDDIGRDGFLERAWDWKKKYGGRIVEQLKKLGSSCDWDRERFTMDEGCSKAVKEVFINYYNKGLIYRGERIINWCPHCRTSISNAEVEYEDQAGHFWHLKYPLTDGSGYVELATTRPETLLGDTAVAVNPKDERYKDIVGKTLTLPLVGREIPVVADSYVDMEFGTGVVKITPAHDPNDFEVGKRHNLPVINVLTEDAKIVDDYPEYAGMDRYEARKKIVEDLEKGGFLAYVEDHEHNVGTCYRCGTTVEPRVSLQWFVKMDELAKSAIKAVEDGSIKFVPERFEKNYLNWMNDIRDWCISRQLWWGHQIPAFYCDDCGETVVTKEDHACCPKCGKEMRQDPDTLDTWFSSALWPFSTLGWPDKTEELEYFYPTNTLVTGYDIIPFWVSRMIVAGMENMKQKPFDTVLIHGLVRDSQGRKMSKSLGNGIDPLVIIDQYGADALRFMLATGNAPGNDMRFIEDKVKSSRNFANKIWNAARFIMMNLPDDFKADKLPENLNVEDKWVISKFNTLAKEVNDNLDKFELGVAVSKLYDFIWDIYCDWYIELTKPRIAAGGETGATAQAVLVWVMKGMLKMLHPFMPFITEELWQNIYERKDGESIMSDKLELEAPTADEQALTANIELLKQIIGGVRTIRNQKNISPREALKLQIVGANELEAYNCVLAKMANLDEIAVVNEKDGTASAFMVGTTEYAVPLGDKIDVAAEIEKAEAQLKHLEGFLAGINKKLSNEKFVANAPEAVVALERKKKSDSEEKIAALKETIAELKK